MEMITKKKGFLLRDVAISAVLAMGIISLLVIAVGSMAVNYGRPDLVSPSFSNNYDKLDSLLGDLDDTREAVTNTQDLSFLGTFSVSFNSVFTAVKLVLNSLDIFGTMSSSFIADYTFLDAGVIKILLGVLLSAGLIVIIFVLLSSVTRGRI